MSKCVQNAGEDSSLYSGHSLRSGYATEAARRGAHSYQIMMVTGHRSDSMVRRYVREGRAFGYNRGFIVQKDLSNHIKYCSILVPMKYNPTHIPEIHVPATPKNPNRTSFSVNNSPWLLVSRRYCQI